VSRRRRLFAGIKNGKAVTRIKRQYQSRFDDNPTEEHRSAEDLLLVVLIWFAGWSLNLVNGRAFTLPQKTVRRDTLTMSL
jgi:hypothetical protein